MNDNKEFIKWLSTYGSVTVQRIFDLFQFDLDYSKLKEILNDKDSNYYHFLRVPFANILNNIIISQAEGYREYIQKVFIDYLLSGSANETNASTQGAPVRESLEEERNKFMSIADEFDVEYFNHNSLIAESQMYLIKIAKSKFKYMDKVQEADRQELLVLVDDFEQRAKQLTVKFRGFRSKFQNIIITVQDLIENLPSYKVDSTQIEMYKESINFDTGIGEA